MQNLLLLLERFEFLLFVFQRRSRLLVQLLREHQKKKQLGFCKAALAVLGLQPCSGSADSKDKPRDQVVSFAELCSILSRNIENALQKIEVYFHSSETFLE